MTKYYSLEPEVAGGWGETTVADQSVHPPMVSKLEYEVDVWLGDDLLDAFPCYVVTERLGRALEDSRLTGFALDEVTITTSKLFEDIHASSETKLTLPNFFWLKVHGAVGTDDFGILNTLRLAVSEGAKSKRRSSAQRYSGKYRLIVSERSLDLLRQFNIEHAVVKEFNG